jgi:aminoglycoside phosphotransferase (APT) family kinase protein
MTAGKSSLAARLAERITSVGIALDRTGLAPCAGGADNLVFACHTVEGRELIVKVPLREVSRYGTAAWAGKALAQRGVPAPQVLWHDDSICVETRCPGAPLTGAAGRLDTWDAAPQPAVVRAATEAGGLLRRVHSIAVRGYGRLTSTGTGPHRTLHESFSDVTEGLRTDPTGGLATTACEVVSKNVWRLADKGARLLLGDCAARHIFLNTATGMISGFIDLESARGGHPLADVAGLSVREHPQVTRALLDGYFPTGIGIDELWALTIHRVRIATFLLLFHSRRSEHTSTRRFANSLTADLAAITSETPTALPAFLQ